MYGMVLVPLLLTAGLIQDPPARRLRPPDAELPLEFSGIIGLRELKDGRVLITDRVENRLYVVDFRSGRREEVGRVGSGPGEFRVVSPLFAIGSDSTVMVDAADRGRWLILHGSNIVATLTVQSTPFGARYADLLGIDRSGRVLAAVLRPAAGRSVDSLDLVTAQWTSGSPTRPELEAVATIRSGFPSSAFTSQGIVAFPARDSVSVPLARMLRDEAVPFRGWVDCPGPSCRAPGGMDPAGGGESSGTTRTQCSGPTGIRACASRGSCRKDCTDIRSIHANGAGNAGGLAPRGSTAR